MIIQTNTGGRIDSGDGLVIAPATAGTMVTASAQLSAGSHTIPAGAYKVEVHNTGLEDITVDGIVRAPSDRYQMESQFNQVTNQVDFTPAISVVIPAGGSAYYVTYRPS